MKWYNWNINVIKTLDFIKNTVLIYGACSIIAWDLNIGHWWGFGRFMFVVFMIANIVLSYED